MKQRYDNELGLWQWSRPARARGLKLAENKRMREALEVAPCAGAWIETLAEEGDELRCAVAPCAGAWIETDRNAPDLGR